MITNNQMERIYVSEMWRSTASIKAKGLRPYYIEDGRLHAILVNNCRNRWGKIFLLTADEAEKAQQKASLIEQLLEQQAKQRALYAELLESTIVHNIIPQ